MREYGQIQCSFWTDPEIQGLSDQARVLACYLLTGPHSNGLGCYRIPDGYIQADFSWTSERVSKGFAELFEMEFCQRCEATSFVLIPKFLHWNPIGNPKIAAAREKEFKAVPRKSMIYGQLLESLLTYGKHLSKPFLNHIETLSKQDPIGPEQDRNKRGPESSVEPASGPDRSAETKEVFEYWQKTLNHPHAKLDAKRDKAVKARLKDGYSVDELKAAIDGCLKSPHHQGENDRSQVYDDLELICRDGSHVDKFIKLATQPNLRSVSSAARQTAAAAAEWMETGT